MPAYFLHSIFIFFILWVSSIHAQKKDPCEPDYKEFMLVFSGYNSLDNRGNTLEIPMKTRLLLEGAAQTRVEINGKKYTIPHSGYLSIEDSFPYITGEYSGKEVITIKADAPLSVSAEGVSEFSVNRFPLIPVAEWGKDYTIPGFQDQSPVYKVNNFIDILAREPKTRVTIRNNKGNIVKQISLQGRRNFEYNSQEDLSGYSVSANKNIGVISGNHCLRLSVACDHQAVMIPKNSDLSAKYYDPGASFFSSTAIHRILATQNHTRIFIDGNFVITLARGEYYEYKKEKPHVIESSSPVLCFFMLDKFSAAGPEYAVDPSVIWIPGADRAVSSAVFSFPAYMAYNKDVRLIMKSDQTDFLLLDSTPVFLTWTPFAGDSLVSYATLPVNDEKVHRLHTSKEGVFFLPFLLGRGMDVSVGALARLGFNDLITGKNIFCPEITESTDTISSTSNPEIILTNIHTPIEVKGDQIEILVFDNAEEDGDIVSLYLNDRLIYPDIKVLKSGIILPVTLEKGKNILTIKAENEGDIYPNTAGITFNDHLTRQTIILHNKKGQSKNLTIISQ